MAENKKTTSDKINLTSVNKIKKQIKIPSIKNLFKKQTTPNRDAEGKFTTGSGGLLNKQKFNTRRALPVVVVTALVGGFFVFRSFAATPNTPAYQYSISSCSGYSGNSKNNKPSKCHDESAEALLYRMSLATLGRQTDWGYSNMTQKLVGDRTNLNDVAAILANTDEARWGSLSNKDYVKKVAGLGSAAQQAAWTKELDQKKLTRDQLATNVATFFKLNRRKHIETTYRYNNQQFVEQIYRKLLRRGDNYKLPAGNSWVKSLNSQERTRATVVSQIARSPEAIGASRQGMVSYVRSKPKVKIVQTAKQKQAARNNRLASLVSSAKTHYQKGAAHHQSQAARLPAQAASQAKPSAPSRAALSAISNLEKQARQNLKHAQESSTNAHNNLKEAEKLLAEAKTVSKYSPDISSSTAESSRNQVAMYAASSKTKVNDINGYIRQITASYKSAEKKYQAEQARVAQERKQTTGSQQTGGGQQAGGVVRCPKDYVQNSSRNCSPKYQSPPKAVCGSGYERAGKVTTLSETQTMYTISEYYCKKAGVGYKDKFTSFDCPAGYARIQKTKNLNHMTCGRL